MKIVWSYEYLLENGTWEKREAKTYEPIVFEQFLNTNRLAIRDIHLDITKSAAEQQGGEFYTAQELHRRASLCVECTDTECAFNDNGICAYTMVKGKAPEIAEQDGCLNGVFAIIGYDRAEQEG